MKKLIVLLLLFGCVEEKIVIYKNCFDMTIPQGNPVKFWLNGVETFNEKVVPGVMQVCFHQKFNNDDVIKLQVLDTEATAYALQILDEDDVELELLTFTETSDVFNLSFTLSDYPSIIDKKIRFKIGTYEMTVVESDDFVSDLETWIFDFGGGSLSDWAWNAANSGVMRNTTLNVFGAKNYQRPTTLPQQACKIRVTYNPITPASSNLKIGFSLKDGSGPGDIITSGLILENVNGSGVVEATISTQSYWEDTTYIGVYLASTGYVAGDNVDFMKFEILTNVFVEVAQSDLLVIGDDDETYLIQYSNESNFAGLDYSAETIFGVRVESSFFKERFPEEDESEEISDGSVVKLSGSVKNQRLLQIEPAPFYFHNLLKRVLQHNTIYIDGLYWEKEEAYEITEINQRQPLQKGQVWLTQKEDGYDTNVYGTLTNI